VFVARGMVLCAAQNAGVKYERNVIVQGGIDYENVNEEHAEAGGAPRIHALVIANDYKRTANPLSCSIDGRNFLDLLSQCPNVASCEQLFDDEATIQNVVNKVSKIGQQVQDGDMFVWYYSGHGTGLPDDDFDEADGQDEAYCFVDENGQISYNTCLRDDDFAKLITENIHSGVEILVLSDCCHSGSVCDFGQEEWHEHKAVAISGCTDSQTSGDIGNGGIMTHSMLCAIDKLKGAHADDGREEMYSVGALYNATVLEDDQLFHSAQDIHLSHSILATPESLVWPLVPKADYIAPLRRMMCAPQYRDVNVTHMDEGSLTKHGVSPAIAQMFNTDADLEPSDDYLRKAEGAKKACSIM